MSISELTKWFEREPAPNEVISQHLAKGGEPKQANLAFYEVHGADLNAIREYKALLAASIDIPGCEEALKLLDQHQVEESGENNG